MITIIPLLIFAAIACAGLFFTLAVRDAFHARSGASIPTAPSLRRKFHLHDRQPQAGPISSWDHWFSRLIVEGNCGFSALSAVLLMMLVGLAVGGMIFVWIEDPLPAFFGVLLGMGVTLIYLINRRNRRVAAVREQLPQAIDILARAVCAGESLDQAIESCGRDMAQPLGEEFRRIHAGLELGLPMASAVSELERRYHFVEMKLFASTVGLHRQTGGNLATTLERLASVLRDRLSFQRQLNAVTGAGRTSIKLVSALGPIVFLYLFAFEPDYLKPLLSDLTGKMLLTLAVVLEIGGLWWVSKLLKSSY